MEAPIVVRDEDDDECLDEIKEEPDDEYDADGWRIYHVRWGW